MKRAAAAACLSLCLLFLFPASPAAADSKGATGESMEAVEKDLVNILKEMESIQSELDRLEEIAAFPKATGIRIEIHRGGLDPAPVRMRILVQGKVEDERDFTKAERDAFSGNIPLPLVFQMPYLPGSHQCRFEVLHPSWTVAPFAEFQATIRKGETSLVRFRLSSPKGKGNPVLSLIKDK